MKIIPELIETLEKRYSILRTIYFNQPIGRRILANKLELGERIVRTEIGFLKAQNLINISAPGMTVTKDGEEVLEHLKGYIHEIRGITSLEDDLKICLGVNRVIVVPGCIDTDNAVLKELGKAAANYLKSIIKDNDILALTGGSTIKEVVDSFPKTSQYKNILVVPSRGGMGKKMETLANTLASVLADKLNGSYNMLHVPENISEEVLGTLMKEKEIKETIDNIHKANIFLYGIGKAEDMARKRGISEAQIEELKSLGAVGEAYGCYFNIHGEVVYTTPTLGITLCDSGRINTHIAVAGGRHKVEAIIAACINQKKVTLVTDESAAKEILAFANFSA
ncbi:sugar-binding transcriptional regulator [Clostridium polynesiense]|uniref:sugar-binding transcriptional regulator n=1 Tax=Clostridium polynesiense TaxID=1325933 RepID=UPI003BFA1E4A